MRKYTEKVEKFIKRVNKDMTTYENFKIVFNQTTPEQDDMYTALSMIRQCITMSTDRDRFNKLLIVESEKKRY